MATILVAPLCAQSYGPWHVLGPLDHPAGAGGLEESREPERELKRLRAGGEGLDLGRRHAGKLGPTSWVELPGDALDVGVIDLVATLRRAKDPPGAHDKALAYLYRRIDCDEGKSVTVSFGSDDGLRLWLNGELVVDAGLPRALNSNDHPLTLVLQPGANYLLAKVSNQGGAWAFQMRTSSSADPRTVNAAIDRGVQWLLENQLLDGTWGVLEAYGGGYPAFAGYTLLKSGLTAEHPAVQMALQAAESLRVDTTYALSARILLLSELGDRSRRERLEQDVAALLEMQEKSGAYAYPVHPENGETHQDLSNTSFAALALRAAELAGVEVDDVHWLGLVDAVLRFQEPKGDTKAKSGTTPIQGFSYVVGGAASGSMTVAGLAVLAICEQCSNAKLPPGVSARLQEATRSGLAWVERELRWFENPRGAGHHFFWVYGLERMCALLGLERIAGIDWYQAGAAYLLSGQRGDGSWYSAQGNHVNVETLLALLFLRRATAPRTIAPSEVAESPATSPSADVLLRVKGQSLVTMWLASIRGDRLAELLDPVDGKLELLRAEFLAAREESAGEPAVVATLGPLRLSPGELTRVAARHEFDQRGWWSLRARLNLRLPPFEGQPGDALTLESQTVRVKVDNVIDAELLRYASDRERNLLSTTDRLAEASSTETGRGPMQACDGSLASAWRCGASDASPALTIKLKRGVKASRVLLCPFEPRLGQLSAPRPSKVRVRINGKEEHTLELRADPLRKTACELGRLQLVRQVEVRVLEATGAELGKACLGFSEIELQ